MIPISKPVPSDAELARILALPRRVYSPEAALALAEEWTPYFLTAEGLRQWHRCAALPHDLREAELSRLEIRLLPKQAFLLFELAHLGGVFSGSPVGTGKTLFLFLYSLVMKEFHGIDHCLILTQAVRKTHTEFRSLSRYWRAGPPATVESYSKISRDENYLTKLAPKAIAGEECDKLRRKSAVTRRVARYIAAAHPKSAWLTGSVTRHSNNDFAPHAAWALGNGSPLPIGLLARSLWGQATDSRVRERPRPVGALEALAIDFPTHGTTEQQRDAVNEGWAEWMADTPGFTLFTDASTDIPLDIIYHPPPADPVIDQYFARFRETDEDPNGAKMSDGLSVLACGTALGEGFFPTWDPPAPEKWLETRNERSGMIRRIIRDSQRTAAPLDTEGDVEKRYRNHPTIDEWLRVKPSFVPNPISVPISYSTCAWAADWLRVNGPALVWTQHTWVGQTIAHMAGVGYYGPGGLTESGSWIMSLPGSESAVLSVRANERNIQLHRWSRNLVVGPVQSAETWEQMIGRTLRQKQEAARVEFHVLMTSAESFRAMDKARDEAAGIYSRTKMPQALLRANWDLSRLPQAITAPHRDDPARPRWVARS